MARKDRDQSRTFTRRAVLLGGGKLLLLSALFGRMYQLQVLEAEKYTLLADENRINLRLLIPPRGRILDRFGKPIATNRGDYRVVMVAERTGGIDAALDMLSSTMDISDDDRIRIKREIKRQRIHAPVTLFTDISWEQVARIEVNAPDLHGIYVEPGLTRTYPLGAAAAHVLGYVGPPAEDEQIEDADPLMFQPDFRVGKSGIEKTHDDLLRGTGGTSQVEVNASGRVQRELSRREGQPGLDVLSTLDGGLQEFCARRLSAFDSAAAVVVDVDYGDVLALANHPSFDPGAFNKGVRGRIWRDLLQDPKAPLTNKSIAGQYSPGSTFKMVVALAGLQAGVINPNYSVSCHGHLDLGSARFHCWKRGGHGAMQLLWGLKQSCDVFFYQTALKVGIDGIADMAHRLGLGSRLGIDIPGERSGLIPTVAWKSLNSRDPKWHPGETVVSGIGQGYVLTTPLQLAFMTARMVNGGKAVLPRLVRGTMDPANPKSHKLLPTPAFNDIGVDPAHLKAVVDAMNGVVNEPGGTAFGARIVDPEYAMGGKTGTSQVRRITPAERASGVKRNEDLPWEQRDHALFVGYAPAHAPRYACTVIVEHGGGGGAVAAPAVRDILLECQRRRSGNVALAPDMRQDATTMIRGR
ncbi:MAG: penicillin-binding protein 2 [Alphaproteobacteria bacterium]